MSVRFMAAQHTPPPLGPLSMKASILRGFRRRRRPVSLLSMRPARSLALVALPALLAGASLHACAASGTSNFGGGGAGSGATTSSTDIIIDTDSGSGGGCTGPRCSADLHSVLGCDGAVIATCPDNQGCGANGACVDPCAAAEANQSTLGCEFFSVIPAPEISTRGSCFAAFLANTWKTPITIAAEYAGQPLDLAGMARTIVGSGAAIQYQPLANGQLGPGELAVLFLSAAPGGGIFFQPCPAGVTPGVQLDTAIDGTALGSAFRITTTAPVVAYDIYPYGGAQSHVTSATLLIPTPAWGTNYVANDGWAMDPEVGDPPFIQFVAAKDGTQVTINPVTAIVGGSGVAGGPAQQPKTYTLNRGQVLQLEQNEELAGSPINADKPISVWGGASCMNIPVGTYACESAHQQLPPVRALGSEYVGVRHRDRLAGANETPPWTLIGAVDGTKLSYLPSKPAGAPDTLKLGQVVRFESGEPFLVRSQDAEHPFHASAHMKGWQSISGDLATGWGDAETVNVVPPGEWLASYLFLTDSTYNNTHLVFVRKRGKDGAFQDVTLDCQGVISSWAPVDGASAPDYEYARLDLVVSGHPNGQCDNGVHTASSAAPFGLTVWGWDIATSYAYPAGMSVQPINQVVVPTVPN
jgi:hypothetical protein